MTDTATTVSGTLDPAKVVIAQLQPMSETIETQLHAKFDVIQVWIQPQLAGDRANSVRGIVSGGHTKVDSALLTAFNQAEIVASFGVGYDHIDAATAAKRGVVVTNTPDVLSGEVADLAIGLLIATIRQIPQAERYIRDGHWQEGAFPLTASLRDRKVGILGLGRIGKAIAKRLSGFDIPVSYHGRQQQPDIDLQYHPTLAAMAEDVDVLMIAIPGGAGTKHMITRDVIDLVGPDGVIVNVGRGSVIDEQALMAALSEGAIGAVGLDVFDNEPIVPDEILRHPRSVVLPHIGSASVRTRNAMGQLVVDNLVSWFGGSGPLTPVTESLRLLGSINAS